MFTYVLKEETICVNWYCGRIHFVIASSVELEKTVLQAVRPPQASAPPPAAQSSRQTERAREVLSQGVASQVKADYLQEESPRIIIHIVRLMLSCLHAWRLDASHAAVQPVETPVSYNRSKVNIRENLLVAVDHVW